MGGLNGDVGRGAESAIGVVRLAVGMGVRNLHDSQDDDQKDADEREEGSPRMVGVMSLVSTTHRWTTRRQGP